MRTSRKNRMTLMPLAALGALSLAVTLPALSASGIRAAQPVSYRTAIVQPGDSLWAFAERATPAGGDVQATVDAIIAHNHLGGASLHPGQHLSVPRP